MAANIFDKITSYSVYVAQNNFLTYNRVLRLKLESGNAAFIAFPPVRPVDWLIIGNATTVYMTLDQYADVYHVLQTEDPVFFTALKLLGLEVGAVHTELDLSLGEPTGEGYRDQSLEALIVQAQQQMELDTNAS